MFGVGVTLPIGDSLGHGGPLASHFPRKGDLPEFCPSGWNQPRLALPLLSLARGSIVCELAGNASMAVISVATALRQSMDFGVNCPAPQPLLCPCPRR